MAKIVAIHGINQEYQGRHVITAAWLPALKDGLELAGGALESDSDFYCGFYGDLFRGKSKSRAGIPKYGLRDINSDWERQLLQQLWHELSQVDPSITGPGELTQEKARTPVSVQQALRFLSRSRYFSGATEQLIIFFLKQVKSYFHDESIRQSIRDRVRDSIKDDTRILIGHSLGTIACYESLCEHPEWPVDVFISLGSPLGIPRLIFDRLTPRPENGLGHWPGSVKTWINIADVGDIVALEKQLNPYFTGDIVDKSIDNGAEAHNAGHYLTSEVTGAAIKQGLMN